ncbi:MAG TPA: low temperature requirement protein A [Jatrophihabitans sp.]|nr:low temperature requirement protein A [Jatrophihabitans sp.]
MTSTLRIGSLRRGEDADRVTNVELFFDLVYVFAVTQLAHVLVTHPTVEGAVQAAVLLAMVWQVWVYTTWAINYLDPGRYAVRLMLLVLMGASLVLAAELPEAFHDRGLLVAGMFAGMQIARCVFAIWALRGEQLQVVFVRILPWSMTSGAVAIAGAFVHGWARAALWAAAVAIDLSGAAFGFYVPGIGRSTTTDWTISGSHFAERCQAFVLIALGESVVVTGAHLAAVPAPSGEDMAVFAVAFAGTVALWWVYFDRSAEDSAERIATSSDPGRLARSAFHWVHPVIVAGIIVAAAADETVLEHPAEHADAVTAWLVLGGTGLYLAGHALFKWVMWRVVSWPRLIAVLVLLALVPLAEHVARLALASIALAVVVGVAIADRLMHPAATS